MAREMTSLNVLVLGLIVCLNVIARCADGYYIREPVYDYGEANLERGKRYTETQDRASSFCTGMCMYEERRAYSDCYDLCNWHGQGPSPWTRLDRQKDVDAGENSVADMGKMLRGAAGGSSKPKSGDKSKSKTKIGTKRWNYLSY